MERDFAGLNGFLAERATMPFAWGRKANDCVAFAIGAALAQGGELALDDLPDWSTALGAQRAIARAGGLAAAVSARLRSVALAHAHRGDIAGVADPFMPGGIGLMVVLGATLVGPGDLGAVQLPRSVMLQAWTIAR